jgi:hypothetical protein
LFIYFVFFYYNFPVKPFLIRGPHDQTIIEGSSVTFQCRVGGDPMPDVLWRRTASGGNMPLGKVASIRMVVLTRYAFFFVCLLFQLLSRNFSEI